MKKENQRKSSGIVGKSKNALRYRPRAFVPLERELKMETRNGNRNGTENENGKGNGNLASYS